MKHDVRASPPEIFMTRFAQRSLRPLIITSIALLLLSLIAPWMWRSIHVGPTPVDQNLAELASAPRFAHSVLRAKPVAPVAEESPASTLGPIVSWEPEPGELAAQPAKELQQYDVTPLVAEIAGPVTERIELDPSLAEVPELPSQRSPSRSSEPPSELMPSPDDLETPLPPPLERLPAIAPPQIGGVWPTAEALLHQLKELTEESPADANWVERVAEQLERLADTETLSGDQVDQTLLNLRRLLKEIPDETVPQPPRRDRTLRLRVGYALQRRLTIWENVSRIAIRPAPPVATLSPGDLADSLDAIASILGQEKAAKAWHSYLRLADLRTVAKSDGGLTPEQRELARDVLRRIDSPRLDKQQHAFISAAPFCRLAEVLQPAAEDDVDWAGLLTAIEQHEAVDSAASNSRVSEMYQVLRWSSDLQRRKLATLLNDNYRNANVRVALSEELLNRFVPPPQIMAEPVNDNVRGADVHGRSESFARLRIVLVPDRLRWKMGLEARGAVASETESSKGPARFWNDGRGEFNARKLITLDRRGMAVARAEANASAEAHLKDFETDFDSFPLFGQVARSIAQRQYENEQPAARMEIEHKIRHRASQRLDSEVDQRIVQAERDFQQKLMIPLDKLNLEPTPVDLHTTPRRLVARYRLASSKQLSAHTPRPQAPGNSLVSMQLHQSLLNNTLENLKLADRRVDLRTLYVEMLRRFDAKEINIPEDLPEDVTVHFAEQDPVRISCDDGRVRLTIRLKELDHAGLHVWKNFEVRGYYRPSDNQLEANLVRDGNIELVGERLKLGDQIALRGIFAKVLSRNRQLSIVNKQLLTRPQLSDLQVTQFVIQDGWIGVALGPKSDNMRPTPTPSDETTELSRRPRRMGLIQGLR